MKRILSKASAFVAFVRQKSIRSNTIAFEVRPLGKSEAAQEKTQAARMALLEGNGAREKNELSLAEKYYRSALSEHPGFSDAHCNLGGVLRDRGMITESEKHLNLALELDPRCAPAAFTLAMIRIEQWRWRDAVQLLNSSIANSPGDATTSYWLGNALMGIGNCKAALSSYKQALRFDNTMAQARWGLAMAQLPTVANSESDQISATKKFAAELNNLALWFHKKGSKSGYLAVGAQQPFYIAYIDGNHRESLTRYGALCCSLMGSWQKTYCVSPLNRSRTGKIRVGIVSAHICRHSVWHALIRGWIEHLNARDFELHVFHVGVSFDDETRFAQRRAFVLHHALGQWTQWAKKLAASRLEAIIYPEIGMDAHTVRLAAMRFAPVQLAAWGHPITTGLPSIDGYITAEAFEPANSAIHYSEKPLPLPRLGCCYQPYGTKPVAVDLLQWNISSNQRLLICPGTPMKYAPQHDEVWVAIAQRCASCRLIFFKRESDELSDMLELRLRCAFESANVSFDDCVRFIPWQSQSSFFGLLDKAYALLDTVGFSGFNTAMQAIERGTPIVAFEGSHMRGRLASGILRELELEAWVTNSTEHYVQLIEKLVCDSVHYNAYRETLRQNKNELFNDREAVMALGEKLKALCRS